MIGTLSLTGQQLAAMGGHLGPRPEPMDAAGDGVTSEAVSSGGARGARTCGRRSRPERALRTLPPPPPALGARPPSPVRTRRPRDPGSGAEHARARGAADPRVRSPTRGGISGVRASGPAEPDPRRRALQPATGAPIRSIRRSPGRIPRRSKMRSGTKRSNAMRRPSSDCAPRIETRSSREWSWVFRTSRSPRSSANPASRQRTWPSAARSCVLRRRWHVDERADEPRLLAVAASIADHATIDWNDVRDQFADGAESSVVDELRIVQEIARIHSGQPSDGRASPAGAETPGDDGRTAPQADPDRARTAWGRFTLVREIGRGAFGVVYEAIDPALQRPIALKLIRPRASGRVDLTRALDEARLLARIRHPNVVTVHGAERTDDEVALWMDLIRGHTLHELVGTPRHVRSARSGPHRPRPVPGARGDSRRRVGPWRSQGAQRHARGRRPHRPDGLRRRQGRVCARAPGTRFRGHTRLRRARNFRGTPAHARFRRLQSWRAPLLPGERQLPRRGTDPLGSGVAPPPRSTPPSAATSGPTSPRTSSASCSGHSRRSPASGSRAQASSRPS